MSKRTGLIDAAYNILNQGHETGPLITPKERGRRKAKKKMAKASKKRNRGQR